MAWSTWIAGITAGFGTGLPIHVRWPKRHRHDPPPAPFHILQSVIVNPTNGATIMPTFVQRLENVERYLLSKADEAEPVVAAIDPALAVQIKNLQALVSDLTAAMGGIEAIRAAIAPEASQGNAGVSADQQFTGTGKPVAEPATLGLREGEPQHVQAELVQAPAPEAG